MWRRLGRGRIAIVWPLAVITCLAGATRVVATSGPPATAAAAATVPASIAFPNDPGFAGCERQDPITGCTDNEQWDLFGPLTGNDCPAPGNLALVNPHPDGGLPCWALKATDPQHASG